MSDKEIFPPGHPADESLDPQDWEATRALGHRMMDDMMDYLQTVSDRPAWQPLPEQVRRHLREPLPLAPGDETAVYEQFRQDVLPYPLGNIHPRFWAWVIGTGTPTGVLAEFLAASMNPNMGGGVHACNLVEDQVLEWMREIFDFPEDSSGLLVSGGSMANLVGLAVARRVGAGFDIRKYGLQQAPHRMTVYGSTEQHSSVQKALELMGMGSDSLRLVPTHADHSIDVEALRVMLQQDRAAGMQPICVVGAAGTVNTGAVDDLEALAQICQEQKLWFHVDGAYGAWAAILPEKATQMRGIKRADSLAFDLHKWMYMPMEIGCVLVRNRQQHRDTFALTPAYLEQAARGVAGGGNWFSEYGLQLSRNFRALKAWMSIKTHGMDKYRRLIRQNIDQACYLGRRVQEHSQLQLLAPVSLNIVVFRYRPDGLDDSGLDSLNQEILLRIQERGIAVPSHTRVNGHYAIRVAHVNHRTRYTDMDLLVQSVLEVGAEVLAENPVP
jgi:glutamate/tyrosine decarboxylase-like PLP-dependent enzyme